MTSSAAQRYQVQQIMSASPAKLVAMLYDRAISSLKEAANAIDRGDIEARFNANKRAHDIIHHLDMTLDMDRGGEIAKNLASLYSFILRRLPQIDFRNDKQTAEDIIRLLEPLRDSWVELAVKNADAGATPQQSAPAPLGDAEAAVPNRQVIVSA